MRTIRARIAANIPATIARRAQPFASSLLGRDGLSIDGLDAAIRAISVVTVLALSLAGYGSASDTHSASSVSPEWADPVAISAWLVLYNLLVIVVGGVPWRRAPGFPLFTLDWAVASVAILLTGGFFSPFIILYYSLVIGAALRVGLSRSMALVVGCALVFIVLSIASPAPTEVGNLPILVVEITALAMVALTAVGMKHTVQAEARRVELEERAARQLRLLNNLTNTVLSASPDLREVMRAVAALSTDALKADRGLTVLFTGEGCEQDSNQGVIFAADREPDLDYLSREEAALLQRAVQARVPVRLSSLAGLPLVGYSNLEVGTAGVQSVLCAPLVLDEIALGGVFVARYNREPFTNAEVDLLSAIGQQVAVAVRLSHLYGAERERARHSEEREQLERDLLSTVSHELRTPLTSIKTSIGALDRDDNGSHESDIEAQLLRNIDRSTDRLIVLVDELLDVARLRAGRVSLKVQELNLGEVIEEVAAQVLPVLRTRKQSLELDLPAHGSPRWEKLTVLADRRRIEQVLLNLLTNAHKYAPGASRIVFGATPRDGHVKVFVRDEGPGISHHEQARVFDRFYQGSHSHVGLGRKADSLGLGLAIARSIVEMHGGEIGVSSTLGHGSTFYFTLPAPSEQSKAG